MRGEGGLVFLLDLPEVRGRDGQHLARLAWHLGNRHLPAAIETSRILIRPDHVIAAMLAGLGAAVTPVEAPFDPEGGAYAAGHGRPADAHPHEGSGHEHHPHG